MADNITVDNGGLTDYVPATDERTIAAATVHIQRVGEIGCATLANGQVTPTTTAATLVAARDTRKRLILSNNGSVDCWVGIATVTTANGFRLPAGSTLTLYTVALIQAIIASGTMVGGVHYIEEYD